MSAVQRDDSQEIPSEFDIIRAEQLLREYTTKTLDAIAKLEKRNQFFVRVASVTTPFLAFLAAVIAQYFVQFFAQSEQRDISTLVAYLGTGCSLGTVLALFAEWRSLRHEASSPENVTLLRTIKRIIRAISQAVDHSAVGFDNFFELEIRLAEAEAAVHRLESLSRVHTD